MKVVVRQWETLLIYKDGVFEQALGPGRHRVRWRRREQLRFDLRPQLVTVANQEILTADGLAPRITLVGRFVVRDAHGSRCDPVQRQQGRILQYANGLLEKSPRARRCGHEVL